MFARQCSFIPAPPSDMVCATVGGGVRTSLPSDRAVASPGIGEGVATDGRGRTMSGSDRRGGNNNTEGPNTGVVVRTRPKTRKTGMYKVLMLNDDYTTMEFVV